MDGSQSPGLTPTYFPRHSMDGGVRGCVGRPLKRRAIVTENVLGFTLHVQNGTAQNS